MTSTISEKTSPFYTIIFARLRAKKKFKIIKTGATEHFIYDPEDFWEELCECYKKINLYIHREEE